MAVASRRRNHRGSGPHCVGAGEDVGGQSNYCFSKPSMSGRGRHAEVHCGAARAAKALYVPKPCLVEAKFPEGYGALNMNVLVDSGSQMSFITRHFCKTIVKVKPIEVTGHDGGAPQICARATDRTFFLGGKAFTQRFLVLPDCPYPVILGLDFLETNRISNNHRTHLTFDDTGEKILLCGRSEGLAAAMCMRATGGDDVVSNPQEDKDYPKPGLGDAPMTKQQRKVAEDLLREHSYCFASRDRPVGHVKGVKHRVRPSGEPFKAKLQALSPAQLKVERDCLDEMVRCGVVRPSKSEWASRPSFAPKKDGTTRFCLNFRKLNQRETKDNYPLPRAPELLEPLRECKYFTSLDAAHGYWQIPIHEDDQKFTAVITHWGLYEFVRLPFGLSNAPATYQRLMDEILRKGLLKYCCCYLDDVLIFSKTFDEHVVHVRQVMQWMAKAGLLLKAKKCKFFESEAEYLGHIVGNGEIRMNEKKLRTIIDFPVPTNVKELQSFLGTTGYYRKFVRAFALKGASLTDLTTKDCVWNWTDGHQRVFDMLKKEFNKNVPLKMPDYSKPFIVDTDASDVGIGAVLSQYDDQGEERPVYFASRKLSPAERKWPVRDKEALAILYGCQTYRHHILGSGFTVRTDHHSLQWLMDAEKGRIARWATQLAEYEPFTIVYRKGEANKVADALSRVYAWSECLPDVAFCAATSVQPSAKKRRLGDRKGSTSNLDARDGLEAQNIARCHQRTGTSEDEPVVGEVTDVDYESLFREALRRQETDGRPMSWDVLMKTGRCKLAGSHCPPPPSRVHIAMCGRGDKVGNRSDVWTQVCVAESVRVAARDATGRYARKQVRMNEQKAENAAGSCQFPGESRVPGMVDVEEPVMAPSIRRKECNKKRKFESVLCAMAQGASNGTNRMRVPYWDLERPSNDLLRAAQQAMKSTKVKTAAETGFEEEIVNDKGFVIRDGIFGVEHMGYFRPWLPECFVDAFLKQVHAHPFSAHMGAKRTASRAAQFYIIPNLRQKCREICGGCLPCLKRKQPIQRVGTLASKPPTEPWEMISMDFCGPYPISADGYKYVLVIIDQFSKFVYLIPTRRADARTVIKAMYSRILSVHPCPKKLLSDNGSHFRNKIITAACRVFRIFRAFSSSYYPQGDGQVERFMRNMNDSLSCLIGGDVSDWEMFMPGIQNAYNNTPHAATLVPPFEVLFGAKVKPLIRAEHVPVQGDVSDEAMDFANRLRLVIQNTMVVVRKNVEKAWMARAVAYNRNRQKISVKVGGSCLVRLTPAQMSCQEAGKLRVRWSDPMRVIAVKESGKAFEVQGDTGPAFVVNATRLLSLPPSTWEPRHPDDDITWSDDEYEPEFPGTQACIALLGELDGDAFDEIEKGLSSVASLSSVGQCEAADDIPVSEVPCAEAIDDVSDPNAGNSNQTRQVVAELIIEGDDGGISELVVDSPSTCEIGDANTHALRGAEGDCGSQVGDLVGEGNSGQASSVQQVEQEYADDELEFFRETASESSDGLMVLLSRSGGSEKSGTDAGGSDSSGTAAGGAGMPDTAQASANPREEKESHTNSYVESNIICWLCKQRPKRLQNANGRRNCRGGALLGKFLPKVSPHPHTVNQKTAGRASGS